MAGTMLRVLQLAPLPGEASGLAGYAAALRGAVGGQALRLCAGDEAGLGAVPLRGGETRRAALALADRWRREGTLEGYDLVHLEIGGGSYREFYLGVELARLGLGPARVVTLHDPPFTVGRTHQERYTARSALGRAARRLWEVTRGYGEETALLGGAAAVLTLSLGGSAAVRRRFPRLRTPVSAVEHVALGPIPARAVAEMPAGAEGVGLLWLGYWVRGAGLDLLLAALADPRLRAPELPPWRLRIAGGSSPAGTGGDAAAALGDRIRRLGLADRVDLLGFVPDEELEDLFTRHQVLVVPRERRGRGRRELMSVSGSMIRAMTAGMAVVATDARAASEEIESGRSGLLVAPGDAAGLAEALRSVVADAGLRGRLGRAAQEHIRRHHAPARVVADHLTLYRSALGTHRDLHAAVNA